VYQFRHPGNERALSRNPPGATTKEASALQAQRERFAHLFLDYPQHLSDSAGHALKLSDFDYELPPNLIAQYPAGERSASRLLHLDGTTGDFADRQFRDLPALVEPGDVLVMNDTRVIKARLTGRKQSGGKVEVLVERVLDHERVLAQIRASKTPRGGSRLLLAQDFTAEVIGRAGEFFELRFIDCTNVFALLERAGSVPLPPYITHTADTGDDTRYQTVYAQTPGAVAAPTAGLHFDDAMLETLKAHGVRLAWITLHVGAGTFQPVRVDDLADHTMHAEWYAISQATVDTISAAKAAGGKIIAVGTTSLRTLESAAASGELRAGNAETRLFILPGYRFRVVDRLLTNFHLPKSTLMMLVSAFGGSDNIRRAYAHAVARRYRFFSYGDAMLIERRDA
ncbi:MAG: tRNA preQ1(34) S-adenosylmethionine ribosyltransferase-isomerase QueA, partial [Rhodocyclales bacterium]|nr:tRNA preQ1(34) S-adenosylmethionine ribosyltransferase-isomerase QueA [Rhodocyclales bacterium]